MPPDTIVRFADDVSRMLSDVMRKFLRRQTKEVVQGNISLPQVFILDALKDKSSMRMGELAGVTGIADKLVKSGFVLRGSVLGDRRVVNISITAKGREVIRRHNRARHKAIMDMFGHLSAEDREKYLEILTKIHQHLK